MPPFFNNSLNPRLLLTPVILVPAQAMPLLHLSKLKCLSPFSAALAEYLKATYKEKKFIFQVLEAKTFQSLGLASWQGPSGCIRTWLRILHGEEACKRGSLPHRKHFKYVLGSVL